MSEIIYFSSSGRTVTLVSLDKSYTFYDTLEDIYSEIKNRHFLYIHKSFIVNYRYVRQYEYEQVTLLDGTVLPISQPRRKLIRKMILEMEDWKWILCFTILFFWFLMHLTPILSTNLWNLFLRTITVIRHLRWFFISYIISFQVLSIFSYPILFLISQALFYLFLCLHWATARKFRQK